MAEKKEIEVLKTALLLEKQGQAFYRKVAEGTDSPAVRNMFTLMAEEEGKHIDYLTQQFSRYASDGRFLDQGSKDAQGSAVQDILKPEIREQISAASFEAAAISAAIEMENRAVSVYSARAEASGDARERELYAWLAQWERSHQRFLAEIDQELREEVWNQAGFWPF